MTKPRSDPTSGKGTSKIPRTFRLTEGQVEEAQEILGTEMATTETALDIVVFRQELIDGSAALRGVKIDRVR